MKIVITGAHFTPAQAVIEELLTLPDTKVVYFGRKYARDDDKAPSAESKILPTLKVKFIPITAGRLNRYFSIYTVIALLKTPIGFIQAFYYLLKEKPDLVLSFGGFVGLPVVICAWLLSIPTIIHEQSLQMGLANSLSSLFADSVAVSFKNTKTPSLLNEDKIVITGNPIRRGIVKTQGPFDNEIENLARSKSQKPLILITAGNQGSHKINLLTEDILSQLTEKYRIVHQTGDSKFDDYENLKKYKSENYLVRKWIDINDLSLILDNADLVISRAGINTLEELAIKDSNALMIPIPVGMEQKENAKFFSNLGLGIVLDEKKLTPDFFLDKINENVNKKRNKKVAEELKENIILNAEQKLVQEVLLSVNQNNQYNFSTWK